DNVVTSFGINNEYSSSIVDIDRVIACRCVDSGGPGMRALDVESVISGGQPNAQRFQTRIVNSILQFEVADGRICQRASFSFVRRSGMVAFHDVMAGAAINCQQTINGIDVPDLRGGKVGMRRRSTADIHSVVSVAAVDIYWTVHRRDVERVVPSQPIERRRTA